MWVARRRRLARVLCIAVALTCVGLTIDAGITGAHVTTIIIGAGTALTWCGLGLTFGWLYPGKVDDWERKHATGSQPQRVDPTSPGVHTP